MIEYNEQVHNYLNLFSSISLETANLLTSFAKIKQYKTNEIIINIGDYTEDVYVITSGVVRNYIILESGKEVTKKIFTPIDIFSSFTAVLNQSPSNLCYQVLSDCEVISLNFLKFREICNNNMELLKLYNSYLEHLFSINEIEHLEAIYKNGKERYLSLRERIPNIDNLIPQYQIASFLNITPVQLSRIRSKLK